MIQKVYVVWMWSRIAKFLDEPLLCA